MLGVVALTASLLAVSPASAAESRPGEVIAFDSMNRSVETGWGNAGAGGNYSLAPAESGKVENGWATLVSPAPGRMARVTLESVNSLNTDTRIDVNVPSLPAANSAVYVAHHARVSSEGSYAVQLGVNPNGSSVVSILRMNNDRSGVTSTSLAAATGPNVRAGKPVSLVLSVTGSETVKIAVRAWEVGAAEPKDWSLRATDDEPSAITAAGAVAATSYASSKGSVTPVQFDNLVVKSAVEGGGNVPPVQPEVPAEPEVPTKPEVPAPSPADDYSAVTYPGQRLDAGAAEPGTVAYPAPANAIFVATNGSDSNPGTIDRPLATLEKATQVVKENGTVVLRGGTYHEDALVYPRRGITIQPYQKEAVWFDGAETVSGWTQSGNVWVKGGWNAFFDSSPTFVKGAPDGTSVGYVWLNPDYPLAAHPDQIWVDDVALTQVGSRAAVNAGTFFVDQANKQLVIGTNPNGKRVDVSTLGKALSIRAEDSTVRGIGVRRYASSMPTKGTVTADFPGITLENMMIVDNATTGFHTWAKNVELRNVTVAGNGYMGFSGHNADGLKVDSLLSYANNTQHFNRTPGSGALKVTATKTVTVQNSSFIDNWGQGVWFDDSVQNITFTGNDVVGTEGNGLVLEISEHATVADNLIANSGIAGALITNTGNVSVWNNTIVGNKRNVNIVEDARRGPTTAIPWVTKNVEFVNNVVAGEAGADCVMCVESWSKTLTGATMLTKSEGNLFHRTGAESPKSFALWANASSAATRLATFGDYTAATGRDKSSIAVEGASPVDDAYVLTSQYASRAGTTQAIPVSIASVSSLPQGGHVLGAQP